MAAFAMFALFNTETPVPFVILALVTLGVAVGIFLAPNNRLVMLQAPYDKQGVASGVYKIFLNIGSVFGIAVIPVVIIRSAASAAGRSNAVLSELRNMPGVLESAFRGAFIFGIIISGLALFFAYLAKDARTAGETVITA
jgi:MFS family permease